MRYCLRPIFCRPWLLNGICTTALELRKARFDARYMAGGHSAWKAIKGPVKLHDDPKGLEAA